MKERETRTDFRPALDIQCRDSLSKSREKFAKIEFVNASLADRGPTISIRFRSRRKRDEKPATGSEGELEKGLEIGLPTFSLPGVFGKGTRKKRSETPRFLTAQRKIRERQGVVGDHDYSISAEYEATRCVNESVRAVARLEA